MNFNTACLQGCTPPQIINIGMPINDISKLQIFDDCECEYGHDQLQYAYSLDNICWSCYMSYDEILSNTIEFTQDYYVRIKISGVIGKVLVDNVQITDYSTELVGCFEFSAAENEGTYNPYANMDNAIALNQQLAESVSSLVGIPAYYIKLNPNQGSKDLTFKEYVLMNVQDIKQVKLVIQDNVMPSSKPEFSEFGLDWQTDWEVEVTKGSFATAFGNTIQPTEGDLIYIPMMKRMWMVSGAYEEKKDAFMWIATTFKISLIKYEEKDSVDLGDTQSFVDSVVKNKYEDLFGDDENQTLDSGEASTDAPKYAANTLYSVYESDATRKYVTCDTVNINTNSLYYKGTLIADNRYDFINNMMKSRIVYQKKYCGDEISLSFIINPLFTDSFEDYFIKIGHIKLFIKQDKTNAVIYINKTPEVKLELASGVTFFVIIRWSKSMNLIDCHAYKYTYNERVPVYKLSNQHYYFNIDDPISEYTGKYNIEYDITERSEVELNNFNGWITNFKLFDVYNDDISELLQMYPTHQHLLINDTARKIVDLPGVKQT